MKDLGLLIWLTQLGISVAAPPVGFILLSVWLHNDCGWGEWVIWVGVVIGLLCGIQGLLDSLRTMDKYVKRNKKQDAPPPLCFNDHE